MEKVHLLQDVLVIDPPGKPLTRLSGLVPSGTLVAMVGSCVLLLPTMPLMSAARVCTCRAKVRWAQSDRRA